MGSKSKSKTNSIKQNLIKGYLPIYTTIPSQRRNDEETFTTSVMYVKEHRKNSASSSSSSSCSLFVVNAPMVPKVYTHIFLHYLFSKFGEVEKVSVVRNPRDKNLTNQNEILLDQLKAKTSDMLHPTTSSKDDIVWSPQNEQLSSCSNLFGIQTNVYDEGKFAHVMFTSSKEMKQSMAAIKKKNYRIVLSYNDLSPLLNESKKLEHNHNAETSAEYEDSDQDSEDEKQSSSSSLLNLVRKRKQNVIPRTQLMEKCNAIMEQFELAEENSRKAKAAASSVPDENGFITVSYSNAVGSKREMEEDPNSAFSKEVLERRGGSKRSRKRKEGVVSGSSELKDFYRFQMRETRKKNVEELRQKFEEDLKAVQKLKDQKRYIPFSS